VNEPPETAASFVLSLPLYKSGSISYADGMDPLERKELQEMRKFDAKEFLAALEQADEDLTRSAQPYMEFLRWVQRQKLGLEFQPCFQLLRPELPPSAFALTLYGVRKPAALDRFGLKGTAEFLLGPTGHVRVEIPANQVPAEGHPLLACLDSLLQELKAHPPYQCHGRNAHRPELAPAGARAGNGRGFLAKKPAHAVLEVQKSTSTPTRGGVARARETSSVRDSLPFPGTRVWPTSFSLRKPRNRRRAASAVSPWTATRAGPVLEGPSMPQGRPSSRLMNVCQVVVSLGWLPNMGPCFVSSRNPCAVHQASSRSKQR